MEFSFSSMFFHDNPLNLIFDAVHRCGADTLEFWPETPDWWLDGLPIDRLLGVCGLYPFKSPLSVHAPVLDLNPCSINPDIVEVSIRWIERTIILAEKIGAGVCTIHPGRRTSKRPPSKTDYRRLSYMLDRIAPLAKKTAVKIAIENMEPQVNALLSTPGEIFNLLDERDWLYFTLDACHASPQGETILSEYLGAGKKIVNVHFSGSAEGKMHLPVLGNQWAERALLCLSDARYDGLVTLEINDLSVNAPLSYEDKISIMSADIDYIRNFI